MKPVSIRFRCFGPYIDEQVIRFDELAEQGLFLICGETGSGKTTILDAMCCALYGSCSGEIRGELEDMRCKQAGPEDPTEVDFVFECGGRRYNFRRTLTPRKSRKAEITFNEDYACRVETDDGWIPLMDNAKKKSMNTKAVELIGLNPDQFRQVIILPQGRFETLLTSKSEDKENILASLFHTERWKKAVEQMNAEVNTRREGIRLEDQSIREGLGRLGVDRVDGLPEALRSAEEAAAQAGEAEKAAKKTLDQARETLELKREFGNLDVLRERLEKARKAAENDRELQVRLEMAERAEKARRPHDEWQLAADALSGAERRLKASQEQLAAAEAELKQAEAAKAACEALAPEQQQRIAGQQRLAGLRDRYLNIDRLQKAADDAQAAMRTAGRKAEESKAKFDRETEKLNALMDAWNRANDVYNRVFDGYRAAVSGDLAASLREGEPCPVCGSTHHPRPAVLPEGAPKGTDVDEAKKKLDAAHNAHRAQDLVRQKAEADRREADRIFTEAKSKAAEAGGALQQELDQRDPELKTLEELDRRSRQLGDAIRAYDDEKTKLESARGRALVSRDTLTGTVNDRQAQKEQAQREFTEKENAWKEALAETGLGTETQYNAMILSAAERQRLRDTLSEHKATLESGRRALEEQQARVEGRERPDPAAAEQAFGEAEARHREALRALTLAEQKRKETEEESKRLTALDAKIAEKRSALERDSAFVSALRGSTGMSLQRYVLSVRLGQVILEANRLLSGIYGGRYRLHRSNESYGSSHKSGLELEVFDSLSDQHRSVCTLSGGEKFLVALSLAIGLCTVVQNEQRGVNLEAMFIDEGFGSLDQNSLWDALDVLREVQTGHGLVGIISHVQLLEESIPTKIRIRKTPRGSTTTVVTG